MKHFVLNRSCNHPMCLLLTLLMSMSAFTSHAQVAINETNFPDENFRNYLLAQSYGEDGVLTENEISQITSISVYNKEISSLTGIEYFTALKELSCGNNKLTALDVSKNRALTTITCWDNQLTALNVSGNTALKELYCSNNQLTALDVTNCNALKTLWCDMNQLTTLNVSGKTALTTLWCESNQLTALNVSGSTALTELKCGNNQLTALDLSGSTALTKLNCGINQLTALDLSGNTALKELDCYENRIKGGAMDALISSLPEITGEKAPFHVIYNTSWSTDGNVCTKEQVAAATAKGWQPMENQNWNWVPYEGSDGSDPLVGMDIAIDETNFPDENFRNYLLAQYYGEDGVLTGNEIKNITLMDVDGKEISSLKGIEHFTALEYLYCSNNQLTALDVSNNTALETLSCNKNQLTALDVSKNTALRNLRGYNNQLTALDISKNTSLETLYCNNNQLTTLDVSGKTALATLSCYSNQLTALDVSGNAALTTLKCYSNQLTTLDASGNTALTELECYSNKLTTLDVSGNTALITIRCNGNQLTSLDVSTNTALTTLRCYSNQLTALNVSGNTALTELDCSSNQLTALDLSGNTALTELDCSNNQLTALDVSNNTALKELDCYENQIKDAAMDALISSLPEITGEKAPFHVIYNRSWSTDGNDCTKEQVAAALAKGWQPMENQNWNWVPYEGSEPEVQIAINETNFPDENFRNYLLAQSYGADGVLTNNEIKGVTKINVDEKEISSLKGIEHFTALETLYCDNNQLTTLDVSKIRN